jgi:hypothetical protein
MNEQFSTGAQRDGAPDKLRYDALSPAFLNRTVRVLTDGANKYGMDNWAKGMPYRRTFASLMRHVMAWWEGKTDEDHLAHACCNLMFLMHHEASPEWVEAFGLDDRPFKAGPKPPQLSTSDEVSVLRKLVEEARREDREKQGYTKLQDFPVTISDLFEDRPMKQSGPERIYVAGPYTSQDEGVEGRMRNVARAVEAGVKVWKKGHFIHVPHSHTMLFEKAGMYEDFMRLDFTYLEKWATGILYLGQSPGADRELAEAERLGLKVYRSIEEVPDREDATFNIDPSAECRPLDLLRLAAALGARRLRELCLAGHHDRGDQSGDDRKPYNAACEFDAT